MTRWWAISDDNLRDALRRVAEGEEPDEVYADLYENALDEAQP